MIDASERAAMEETVHAALAEAMRADAGAASVDAVLSGLGWRELLAEAPHDAIGIVFGALGRTNATATALDDVLASALGEKPRDDLAVVLPRFAIWKPPGAEGLATARAAAAQELLVVGGTADEPWLAARPRSEAQLRAAHGIDPALGLHRVRIESAASASARIDAARWSSAVALGRCALAAQLAGACRAMLDLARSHAQERTQFGRPIARFQAVRHRLADAFVAVEALDAALVVAREEPSAETAALAKAVAGRTAHTVMGHCQQVLAGIGFTTEHAFHRFAKRALVLEGLFGSADEISLDVGRRLLAERRVPTLIEL